MVMAFCMMPISSAPTITLRMPPRPPERPTPPITTTRMMS
jgi:hypothetical protein